MPKPPPLWKYFELWLIKITDRMMATASDEHADDVQMTAILSLGPLIGASFWWPDNDNGTEPSP